MLKRNAMAVWAAFAILLAACTGANPAGSASPAGSAGPSTSGAPAGSAGAADLTIESWRNDDLAIWQDTIIPAFEAPSTRTSRSPSRRPRRPSTTRAPEHQAPGRHGRRPDHLPSVRCFARSCSRRATSLRSMTCRHGELRRRRQERLDHRRRLGRLLRPDGVGDPRLHLQQGYRSTSSGITSRPTTVEEFHALLDQLKTDGTYTPLAMGTKDLWESATMGFQNIGPNYWKGEEGRQALSTAPPSSPTSPTSTPGPSWPTGSALPARRLRGASPIRTPSSTSRPARRPSIRPARGTSRSSRGQGLNIGFFGPPVAQCR